MLGAQSASQGQIRQQPPAPKNYEEYMTWRIRWFLIISITIALIGGLIGFGITKDSRFLLFITPTSFIPFMRYLIPMDKRRYELELAKIHTSKELSEARLQVKILKAELGKQQGNKSTFSAAKMQGQLPTK
jgi:hypothetical protein